MKVFDYLFLVILFKFGVAAPQIFTEIYKYCDIEIGGKKTSVPDKLWTISRKDFSLHFSLCKSVKNVCLNQSSSCLITKSRNQIINVGTELIPAEDDNSVFVSTNSDKCISNPKKNYTLQITLQCSDSMSLKPRLIPSDDDCTFDIFMMSPDCHPRCTELIEGAYFLDLRNLKKNFQIQTESSNFSISFCRENLYCSQGVSVCEIFGNQTVPLASFDSQHINYDVTKNELTVRGRYKQNRVVRDVQVLIKCNWKSDFATPKYHKIQTKRHYKFEVESSFGCVKLPHSCVVSSLDNLHYNLTKLSKPNGWKVSNVPKGEIFINICSPLKNLQGACLDQHSQVCHKNNNTLINRGSILSSLKSENDRITATFVSGSSCKENVFLAYSTIVEFQCSYLEKGPVFKGFKECVMKLVWETPHACPIDLYIGQNCYVSDRISNRNLKPLYKNTDFEYSLTTNNDKIVYNLCGPLHNTCNGYKNTSFCLKTNKNEEIVLGFENNDLISKSSNLVMQLEGSWCLNKRSKAQVTVYFICSYEFPSPATQINVLEDSCKFNVTIFTSLACFSQKPFKDCVFSFEDNTYNLTSLVQKNRNYLVSNGDTDFAFNLCGPIISTADAQCGGNTMFCKKNNSEPNIKYRHTTLGEIATPSFRNNTLIIEAGMGSYCEGLGYYMSIIYFVCSKKKFSPIFLHKENCVYKFKWKTPEACPQVQNCTIHSVNADKKLDLSKINKKIVKVKTRKSEYTFHLCKDVYSIDEVKEVIPLSREYILAKDSSNLILDLHKQCTNRSTTITKVIFKLECSVDGDDHFEQISFEDCILNMNLQTSIICAESRPIVFTSNLTNSVGFHYEISLSDLRGKKHASPNCSVNNSITDYQYYLNKMKSQQVFHNNNSFVINFDGELTDCDFFCKNKQRLIGKVCPSFLVDFTHQSFNLTYSGDSYCGSNDPFILVLVFKCSDTKSDGSILQDEKCKTAFKFNSPEACLLLEKEIISSENTAVVITSIIGVVIAAVAVIFYLRRRKHSRGFCLVRNKSSVPIYIRDCSL